MPIQCGDIDLDRFLRNGEEETIEEIEAGRVDSFLDVILMFEGSRQNREPVKQAAKARRQELRGYEPASTVPLSAALTTGVIG